MRWKGEEGGERGERMRRGMGKVGERDRGGGRGEGRGWAVK